METRIGYREIVRRILQTYANIRYANGDFERELVLDTENDRYLLMTIGWEGMRRIYYTVIHIDIIDEKL